MPRPKTNLVRSKAVRKPLVAITLNILSTMFYVLEEIKMSIVPLSHIRNTNTVSDVVSPSPKGGGDSPPLNPPLICYVACLHSKYFGVAVCVVGDRRVSSGSLGIPERISASCSHTHFCLWNQPRYCLLPRKACSVERVTSHA